MSTYDPPPGVPFARVEHGHVWADTECERRPVWAAMAEALRDASVDMDTLSGAEELFTVAILRGKPGVYRVAWWPKLRALVLSYVGRTVEEVRL